MKPDYDPEEGHEPVRWLDDQRVRRRTAGFAVGLAIAVAIGAIVLIIWGHG